MALVAFSNISQRSNFWSLTERSGQVKGSALAQRRIERLGKCFVKAQFQSG